MKRMKIAMASAMLLAVLGAFASNLSAPPQNYRRALINQNTPCDIVVFDCDGDGQVCEDGTYKYYKTTDTGCLLPEEKALR